MADYEQTGGEGKGRSEAWVQRDDPFLFERVEVLESAQNAAVAMMPGWCACAGGCNCFCGCGCGCY